MTNAIDILCVGGPRNSTVVCMNRARMNTFIELGTDGGGVVTYTRKVWTDPETTLQYHVATQPGEGEAGDVDIANEIALSRFPPAWDLN